MKSHGRTLIVHTANLGDVVSAASVITGAAVLGPVDIFLRKSFRGLFFGEHNITEVDDSSLDAQYERVIDLDSSSVSRTLVKKIKSREKIGRYQNWVRRFKYSNIYTRQFPKNSYGHIVKDYRPIAQFLGCDPNKNPSLSAIPLNKELSDWFVHHGKDRNGMVVVHFEASNPIRSLPESLVLETITGLTKKNRWVLLLGTPSAALEALKKKADGKATYLPFSMLELKAILPKADLFIGPDSGPMHLAAALGVPCLGVYGPTLAKEYAPLSLSLGLGSGVRAVAREYSCRPCNQNRICPYQRRCLTEIKADEVLNLAEQLVSPSRA